MERSWGKKAAFKLFCCTVLWLQRGKQPFILRTRNFNFRMCNRQLVIINGRPSKNYILPVQFIIAGDPLNSLKPDKFKRTRSIGKNCNQPGFIFLSFYSEMCYFSLNLDICLGGINVLYGINGRPVDLFIGKEIQDIPESLDSQFLFKQFGSFGTDSLQILYFLFF